MCAHILTGTHTCPLTFPHHDFVWVTDKEAPRRASIHGQCAPDLLLNGSDIWQCRSSLFCIVMNFAYSISITDVMPLACNTSIIWLLFILMHSITFSFSMIIMKCNHWGKQNQSKWCMQNWDEQIDKCVSWQTITTINQTEKQQLINIHWQNVSHSDTFIEFYCTLTVHLPGWKKEWRQYSRRSTIHTQNCFIRQQIRVTCLHLRM